MAKPSLFQTGYQVQVHTSTYKYRSFRNHVASKLLYFISIYLSPFIILHPLSLGLGRPVTAVPKVSRSSPWCRRQECVGTWGVVEDTMHNSQQKDVRKTLVGHCHSHRRKCLSGKESQFEALRDDRHPRPNWKHLWIFQEIWYSFTDVHPWTLRPFVLA